MRPNHQNKRMRGRNRGGSGGGGGSSGGGRGPNPLTRSYESNGPDVKVRGTAQSIAEKYLQLGRDAQATGDYVAAESFFQHAEHYLRLIAAAQEQYQLQNPGFRGFDAPEGESDDNDEEGAPFSQGQPQPDVRPAFRAQTDQEGADDMRQPYAPQDQREYSPRDQQGRQLRDQRPFPPREPREQRDQRFQSRDQRGFQPREQRDYQPRDGQQRDQQPREQHPRFAQPSEAPDQQPREYQPREPRQPQETGRQESGRQESGRQESRYDGRRTREPRPAPAPMPLEAEQPSLPTFITAPVRVPVVSEPEISATPRQEAVSVTPESTTPIGVKRRGRPPKARPAEDTPSE